MTKRAKVDRTNPIRQARATAQLIAQGGRRITVRVPPQINDRLAEYCKRTGQSANAAILRLLDAHLPH